MSNKSEIKIIMDLVQLLKQKEERIVKLEQDNPLGIVVVELTAESARQFGLQVESGVVIREVAEGSPAAEAGLRAGLVLQEMDSKPMANLEDFRTALADADLEKGVLLYVTSGSGGQYIVLRNH